ncbi:winged helix-turn-helix domain-containing protein [Variovorax sp. JS1663]|uniref:winged helix-turn-helix domain-containing protein n=1 Tax=Variovorax sp. JS1663 TaxID=1851577 RepID=UPI000B343C2F|nr:winged helix-turn-helix domain-containing protein [Variovorax sp. JS1663]OUM00561.1 hypothetical protein A8M77_21070 [Variovorax sp. JS1663]
MSIADTILNVFGADEELTNRELCARTGYGITVVATYTARLRERGLLEYVGDGCRPVVHRLAGAARIRAEMLASAAQAAPDTADGSILGNAKRQPASVFDLGRCS